MRRLLNINKVRPKRSLGQNFITDNNFLLKMNGHIESSKRNIIIEIGPGKVLSGMVKRTVKNINCFSINSIDDMKKTNDQENRSNKHMETMKTSRHVKG